MFQFDVISCVNNNQKILKLFYELYSLWQTVSND